MLFVPKVATLTPGLLQPSIAVATHRAGELGMLDFEYIRDRAAIASAILRFNDSVRAPFGIKLRGDDLDLLDSVIADFPSHLKTIVLTSFDPWALRDVVPRLRKKNITTLLEALCLDDAKCGEAIGVDGVVAKGHEAGGRVADETTFILLQRFKTEIGLPVWAHGGIGLYTAAACAAAGAAGIILDSQLALVRESPLPASVKARIGAMDGSETICLGNALQETYRMYFRPGSAVVKELQELESRLLTDSRSLPEIQAEWRAGILSRAAWGSDRDALLLGQDAAFASSLAERYRTVGGVLHAIREAIRTQCEAAIRLRPLDEGSPLAQANGTQYPILQGPMTRVSDVPEFAGRVAEGGALPFLAIALMRGPEVKAVLEEAKTRLGTLPWGVGILGFVPPELREEQIDVISQYRPPFALIAGGRPDQARAMEQKGIATYLHVPSPGLLKMFIQQGARRFVFEGRECGGHVGPRTSFVLWNQMMEVLLAAPELGAAPEDFHIVFAAGIHDALSASMVAVLAAPLAERGVRVGVLIGTAYLFTEEASASGAILKTFQDQAVECNKTVLLETGPGHSTRCVDTPFAAAFAEEKLRLLAAGRPAEEIRMTLEGLNLGRLRIASKGVTRNPDFEKDPTAPKLVEIDRNEQVAQGMYMIGQVAALRNSICTVRDLHRDVAVEGSKRLDSLAEPSIEDAAPLTGDPSEVAIVGMACIMPKAPNLQTYWENILNKVDAIGEIPKTRWDWELYFDSDPKAKDKIYSKWGGFLENVHFDPMQYGMPPASLRSIEPAQLLTLEVVRAALDDAGYATRPFHRERTSVILGAGGGAADLGLGYGARSFMPVLEDLPEFQGRSKEILERLDGRLPEWTEDSFAGILTNVSAGRVANRFDFGGSNYTVDAACASSLAAVSLALKELEGKTSDMVIAGGIDTMQNPFTYLCFSKTHALSPRGRCRTFDDTADGIAISEGIAMMVFKRLADAERDGDRIYAVIKAAGSSSDGKDRGLTAPRPEGQARALKRAYAKAGFSPATVGLVEAHGTGTVAGDAAEVQALTGVFSDAGAPRQGCAIGSVKSMVGHTKCSAGAAGLIKTALALHHRVLPPTLGVDKPSTRANFPQTPFFVNTEARPWLESSNGHPRRAGVSAFGFGGTNFHIVVEEYTGDPFSPRPAASRDWSDELFVWKADSRQALLGVIDTWNSALACEAKPLLRDLAFTAWKAAENKPTGTQLRLAIVASSLDDLKQKLALARQALAKPENTRINDPRGIYFSEQPLASQGKLAFLFPGQGSQYPGMLQDLLLYFPEMRLTIEQAVRVLETKLEEPLSSYLFPPPTFNRDEEQARQRTLTQTNIAQPAIGAVSMAMFKLLQEFGLQPDMAAGHSYGEYTALAAAGVFSPETLIALSEARGRFIVEGAVSEPGVMAAVEADAPTVAKVLNFEGVCLANANAPRQSVISGSRVAVERAVDLFAAQDISVRMIPVACAFHSPLVAPAQATLADFLSNAEIAEATMTVYSNTTAAPYPTEAAAIAERLVDHLVKPVEFVKEIEAMYDAGARVFVEVGPRGVLTNLVDKILGERPKLAAASNQSSRPGLTQLLHLLGQLAAQGFPLKLDRLFRDRSNRLLPLDALARECGDKAPASSVWMVNGARAIPLKEFLSPRPRTPRALPAAPVPAAPVPAAPAPYLNGATAAKHAPPTTAPVLKTTPAPPMTPMPSLPSSQTHPSIANSTVGPDGAPQVMAQFQQMMTYFLDSQKTVMLAYLGTETGAPTAAPLQQAIPPPVHANVENQVRLSELIPSELIASEQAAPLRSMAASAGVVSTAAIYTNTVTTVAAIPPQLPSVDKEKLTAQLLSIVSERTGYPPDMLDLNLDLEADLGIDSIKRVEILGTFQQSFDASGIGFAEGLMEKLSGVRTLRGIVEGVTEQLGAPPDSVTPLAATPRVSVQPIAAVGPSKETLTAQLLAIVSDRTGYPPEMLDLNLDLEADLGIDSIKRVEILGTFQQSFASSGVEIEEGSMERLSGVRTLQGIVESVTGSLGVRPEQVPAVVAAPTLPAEPIATAGPNKEKLTGQLLAIVSERTGYPPEMLDLNLDLEADLGIDSIKRVEILGTFQQSFAGSGIAIEEGAMEQLSGVRTLQGIIEGVFGKTGAALKAEVFAPPPPAAVSNGDTNTDTDRDTNADNRIQRFTLSAVETPLVRRTNAIAKDRVILITECDHLVSKTLSGELLAHGHRVALVRQSQNVEELAPGSYAADLASVESATELIDLVSRRQGPLGAIVHLLPLQGNPVFGGHDYESWKAQLRLSVKSLFSLSKAAGKDLRSAGAGNGASLIAATGMGGAFLSSLPADETAKFPDHGAVAGLIKTLAIEWPEVRVKVVDLNLDESGQALARHLSEELLEGDEHVEVGYNSPRRITLQSTHAPLPVESQPDFTLDPSSVVLITGGARGITARAAIRLAELYRPTLVLAGRSPLPAAEEAPETAGIVAPKDLKAALMDRMRSRGETVTPAIVERAHARLTAEREIRSNLDALRQLGSQVYYYPVDVRDVEAFGTFVDGLYTSFGRLDGVIHGAGVIEDKLIEDKTPESFDRVFDTKVDSAFILSRKLRPETLKFLLFFSSVSGRFGNRGQGDYAAANEVLNKLAVNLAREWPGQVVAIDWGPWETEGMVSDEMRKQFAERGVELITPPIGLRLLEEELKYGHRGEAEIVIGGARWLAPAKNQDAPPSWPLLGAGLLSNTAAGVELVRQIDLAHDLYLNDHRIDGKPVLPLAVATELMMEVVAKGWPAMQVAAIRDLRVLHGIVLDGGSKSIRVLAKHPAGPSTNSLAVAVEVTDAGQSRRAHYRATVELAQRLPGAPALEVPPLSDGAVFSMSIPDLYRQWLFHGPLFQGIGRVDQVGPGGISASLKASSPEGWITGAGASAGPWLIDPLMFDSALQLLVLWAREHWDMTALPSGFQSYRRFAAPPASRIVCEMRIKPNTGGQTIHADVFFKDAASGNILGILEDMQGSCSRALNRLAGRRALVAI